MAESEMLLFGGVTLFDWVKGQGKKVQEHIQELVEIQDDPDSHDSVRVRVHAIISRLHGLTAATSNRKTFESSDLKEMGECLLNNLALFDEKPELVSNDVVYWSLESILYLTIDPEIKELVTFTGDFMRTLKNMVPVKKSDSVESKRNEIVALLDQNSSWRFNICSIVLNCLNAAEKKKDGRDEEIEKLRTYAGDSVPQPNPMDGDEYVEKRVKKWIDSEVIGLLIRLADSESSNVRHICSLCLLKVTSVKEARGKLAQQGACKLSCDLALS